MNGIASVNTGAGWVVSGAGESAGASDGSTAGGSSVIGSAPCSGLQQGHGARKLSIGECRLHQQRVHVSPHPFSVARWAHVRTTGPEPLAAATSSHTMMVRSALM